MVQPSFPLDSLMFRSVSYALTFIIALAIGWLQAHSVYEHKSLQIQNALNMCRSNNSALQHVLKTRTDRLQLEEQQIQKRQEMLQEDMMRVNFAAGQSNEKASELLNFAPAGDYNLASLSVIRESLKQ